MMREATLPAPDPSEPSAGSRLCLSCGLCCQGLLHRYIRLEEHEPDAMRAIGLTVLESSDPHRAALPCPAYRDGACSVYAQRPTACSGFRCRLLREVDDGTTSLTDGLAVVASAHALVDRLAARLHDAEPDRRIWERVSTFVQEQRDGSPTDATTALGPEGLLDLVSLAALVRRRFQWPPNQPAETG